MVQSLISVEKVVGLKPRDKDMQEKYRKHMKWWLDEFGAGNQVDQYFLSEDAHDHYFEIPTYVLKELQMWIRLNQQILLDYWHQIIDTCSFLCVMIRLPKYSVDVSMANLCEERIFPVDKFKIELCSTDSCRPHFHVISREEGYDIRVDTQECFLINVDRFGKRNVTDSFSDVIKAAKEWLCQKPAHPKESAFNTNREKLLYLWEINHN